MKKTKKDINIIKGNDNEKKNDELTKEYEFHSDKSNIMIDEKTFYNGQEVIEDIKVIKEDKVLYNKK